MKKILILFMLTLSVAFGQNTVTPMKSSYNLTSDTATNTGNAYVSLQVQRVYNQVSIQAIVTKISGTVAGNVILQGSLDGTNFKDISTDTLTNSNQTTNTKVWIVDNNPYFHYRLLLTGAGTMSATIKGYVLTTGNLNEKRAIVNLKSVHDKNSDTIINTATEYLNISLKNSYKNLVIQPIVTRISGTAGGTITLEASNDGLNYVTISSSYSDAQTLSVSNQVTNTKLFKVTGNPYFYYRLKYVGSGTMSCKLEAYLLPSSDDLK